MQNHVEDRSVMTIQTSTANPSEGRVGEKLGSMARVFGRSNSMTTKNHGCNKTMRKEMLELCSLKWFNDSMLNICIILHHHSTRCHKHI